MTITDIEQAHGEVGKFFFSAGAMEFFGSKVYPGTYERMRDGRKVFTFVTSEQPPHGARRFTVRGYFPDDHDIITIGKMCAYTSRDRADDVARSGDIS